MQITLQHNEYFKTKNCLTAVTLRITNKLMTLSPNLFYYTLDKVVSHMLPCTHYNTDKLSPCHPNKIM